MDIDNTNVIPNFNNESNEDLKFSFQIVEESSKTIIIQPIGRIHTYNANHFEDVINKLIDQGYIDLFFDMSNTSYISAVGIGSFFNLLNRAKSLGGGIILDRIQPHVLEVFNLPGFADIFTINGVKNEVQKKLIKEAEILD
jgi:anti-sigma B factor antagonist